MYAVGLIMTYTRDEQAHAHSADSVVSPYRLLQLQLQLRHVRIAETEEGHN